MKERCEEGSGRAELTTVPPSPGSRLSPITEEGNYAGL